MLLPPTPKRVRLAPRPVVDPQPGPSVDDDDDPQPTPGPSTTTRTFSEAVPIDLDILLAASGDTTDDEELASGGPPAGDQGDHEDPVIVAVEGPINPPRAILKGRPKTKKPPKKYWYRWIW